MRPVFGRAVAPDDPDRTEILHLRHGTLRYDDVGQRRSDVGRIAGDRWCILSGVEPGEWVVTAGIQKLHNGQKVIPTPINTNK